MFQRSQLGSDTWIKEQRAFRLNWQLARDTGRITTVREPSSFAKLLQPRFCAEAASSQMPRVMGPWTTAKESNEAKYEVLLWIAAPFEFRIA